MRINLPVSIELLCVVLVVVACGGATQAPPTAAARPMAVTTVPTSPPKPEVPKVRTRDRDQMLMLYVPAGTFFQGSTEARWKEAQEACVARGDKESDCSLWAGAEYPRRSVYLDAYWIDKTEVTNAQYQLCIDGNGACSNPSCEGETGYGAGDLPVVCVTWIDAKAYCGWAGARLPTEAEWEKAARGTEGNLYPWGQVPPDCSRANYADCVGERTAVGTYPIGASPYGALDMAGNVWEWVNDRYDAFYYGEAPDRNPQGPDSGRYRVTRGGDWHSDWWPVSSTSRFAAAPDTQRINIGFRCALTAEPSP